NYVAKATDAKLSSYLQQLDKLYLPRLSEAASNCGNTFASLLSTTRSTEQPPQRRTPRTRTKRVVQSHRHRNQTLAFH
ncbi:hypothetical protein F442_16533, partial [Phytophthora nicotianae P10297]